MFHTPDTETLRLCSVLSSCAFGLVLALVWFGQRDARYLLHWAASAVLYAGILVCFGFTQGRTVPSGVLLGVLAATNMLLISGLRAFDGLPAFSRWMAIPIVACTALHFLPVLLVGAKAYTPAGLRVTDAIDTVSVAISALLAGLAFLRSRHRGVGRGRLIAGLAMMGYMPGYVVTLVGELATVPHIRLLVLIPMLSDQLLLCVLNLGLLAMPAERAQQRLLDVALRDPLTGAWNRAGFEAHAARLITPGAVVLAIDLDHFKRINDQHGHLAGDQVLKAVARLAGDEVTSLGGEFGRLGGDEFLAILPVTEKDQTELLIARLHRACRQQHEADTPAWAMSIGAAEVVDGDTGLQDALQRADRALYRAKVAGRDKILA